MKTNVNQHDNQLNTITLLVSISLILLMFGIYKVFSFNSSDVAFNYERSIVTNNEQVINSNVGEVLYTHHYLEETTIKPLTVEVWMTDLSSWNVTGVSVSSEIFNDFEPELDIEPWMLNDEEWNEESNVNMLAKEDEESLELASWMLNLESWEVPIFTKEQWAYLNEDDEVILAVESWMMNCCTWVPEVYSDIEIYKFRYSIHEDVLALESWMFEDSSWLIEDEITVKAYLEA